MNENERNQTNRPSGANRPRPVRQTTPGRPAGGPSNAQRPAAGRPQAGPTPNAQRPAAARGPQGPRPAGGAPGGRPAPARRPAYSANDPAGELPRRQGQPRPGGAPSPRSAKKPSKGVLLTPFRVTLLILGIVGLLLAGSLIALRISGLRYLNYDFVEQLSGERYSIRFIGKTGENEQPLSGTIHYSDGSTASLETKDGKATITYKNGDVYTGELQQLQKHGNGVLTLASGDSYEGSFAYDEMSGSGTYRFLTGDVYVGSFAAGKKSGYGVYTWAPDENGHIAKYEGYFAADMRNGEGVFTYADGSVYTGNFVDDKKSDTSGELKIQHADGSYDLYEGEFRNDLREGHGVYTWANGDVYVGNFKNNLLHDDDGVYTWAASGRTYRGSFSEGRIDQNGAGYYTSGDAGDTSGSADSAATSALPDNGGT